MPVGRDEGLDPSGRFARYKPGGFATLPEGIVLELVARRVGRNGWAVMVALCRKLYEDGRLGMSSAKEVSRFTGLTAYQVARGMTELRDIGVIVPVVVKDSEGRRRPDRSSSGHVARYCVSRDVWATVEVDFERAEIRHDSRIPM